MKFLSSFWAGLTDRKREGIRYAGIAAVLVLTCGY